MKSSSTVRNTWRGSQNYMEKRRGRREIEVIRRRRGGIKRSENKLASNHFPMCSPQSGSLRNVHRVIQRRGRKETEVARGIKGESKGERQIQPVISSLSVLHFSIGEGNGHPLQYSCLENPMDGGAWWAAVHGVAKSQTQLSDFTFTFPFHALEKEMVTHSSVLAWRVPGMAEPGGLPSMGSHRVGHD